MGEQHSRTTILGLFVVCRRPLSAAEVVALSRPLGLSPSNARCHLSRMVASGDLVVEGARRLGRYSPSPRRERLIQSIEKRIELRPGEPWDGQWVLVSVRLATRQRELREKLRRRLLFEGFCTAGNGLYLRPYWPRPELQQRLDHVLKGVDGLVLRGRFLGLKPDPGRLYPLDRLEHQAQKLLRDLRRAQAAKGSSERVFSTWMRLGGRVARLISSDPVLPAEIWGNRSGLSQVCREFSKFVADSEARSRPFLKSILNEFAPGASHGSDTISNRLAAAQR